MVWPGLTYLFISWLQGFSSNSTLMWNLFYKLKFDIPFIWSGWIHLGIRWISWLLQAHKLSMKELGVAVCKFEMPLKATFQMLDELHVWVLGKVVASLIPLYSLHMLASVGMLAQQLLTSVDILIRKLFTSINRHAI